jgi:predicted PurR-regulated permease PerM
MTKQQAFNISFFVTFIALLIGLGVVFSPFFAPIAWALILSRVAFPVHQRLVALLRGRENVAALLSTLMMVSIAVIPAILVFGMGAREGVAAFQKAGQWIEEGKLRHVGEWLSTLPLVGTFGQEIAGRLIVEQGDIENSLLVSGKAIGSYVAAQGTEFFKNAMQAVLMFVVMLFAMFFCFRDGARLYDRLYRLLPMEEAHKLRIVGRLSRTVTAVVRGTLLTAVAQGVVSGLAYWLLGVPFPVFLGALSGLLSMLPVGGTGFVWGPVTIYLMAEGDYLRGTIMLLVGSVLVGLMDNFLYPWLVGVRLKLPMVLLFFASLGGMAYFGFLGLFVGPILLAVVLVALDIYEEDFSPDGHRIVDPRTVDAAAPPAREQLEADAGVQPAVAAGTAGSTLKLP